MQKLQKALYGLMRASLLFYRKLRKEFEDYRLVVNPYDPCVANMTTRNGNQLIAVWHVDDPMVLCVEDFELTKFSCYVIRSSTMSVTKLILCQIILKCMI